MTIPILANVLPKPLVMDLITSGGFIPPIMPVKEAEIIRAKKGWILVRRMRKMSTAIQLPNRKSFEDLTFLHLPIRLNVFLPPEITGGCYPDESKSYCRQKRMLLPTLSLLPYWCLLLCLCLLCQMRFRGPQKF